MYAVNNGANVLSNSWGGGGSSQLIRDAIDYAGSQNRVVVVAAGNDGLNAALWSPANIRGALTVAALEPSLKRASFSNFGSVVDFSAPGVDVLSLRAAGTDMYGDGKHFVPAGDFNAKYYRADGTSMPAPLPQVSRRLFCSCTPPCPKRLFREYWRLQQDRSGPPMFTWAQD
jgi:subtilisin family serine protease